MQPQQPQYPNYPPLPPPPGRPGMPRRRSDNRLLFGILFGCLGVFLIGGAIVAIAGYRAFQAAQKPVTTASIKARFSAVPIYPGATLDEEASKAVGGVMQGMQGMIPGMKSTGMKMDMCAYRSADSVSQVVVWYDQKMAALGWSAPPGMMRPASVAGQEQRMYQKGNTMLQVIAQRPGLATHTQIMLMLMDMPAGAMPTPPSPPGGP